MRSGVHFWPIGIHADRVFFFNQSHQITLQMKIQLPTPCQLQIAYLFFTIQSFCFSVLLTFSITYFFHLLRSSSLSLLEQLYCPDSSLLQHHTKAVSNLAFYQKVTCMILMSSRLKLYFVEIATPQGCKFFICFFIIFLLNSHRQIHFLPQIEVWTYFCLKII